VHFLFFWVVGGAWGGAGGIFFFGLGSAQRETYLRHVWASMLGSAECSREIDDGLINEAPSFQK